MTDTNFEKLKKLISTKLGVSEEEINNDSYLQEDLNADPLSVADLVLGIENEFKIKVPEQEAAKFVTVQNILDYINDQAPL